MTIKKPENLIEWLRALPKETEWAEFKVNNSKSDSVGKYVSALANSAIYNGEAHGFLVFGIEDGTHNLVGTKVDLASEKVGGESFLHWLNKMLSPSLNIEHCRHEVDGKLVEILRIDPAY